MDILDRFKYLQVVSIVVQELENHLNLPDKDLAEFVINLADSCPEVSDFVREMNENGGEEFPEQLVENMYQTIRKLRPGKVKAEGKLKTLDDYQLEQYAIAMD